MIPDFRRILPFLFLLIWGRAFSQFMYWDYAPVVNGVSGGGINPDMVIDGTGGVHISYWDKVRGILIYGYKAAPASAWLFEEVHPDSSVKCGWVSSIAVDASNTPHIAFFENQGGLAQLRYAKRDSPASWTVENLSGHPSRGHWGEYGPSATTVTMEHLNASIDLRFMSPGNNPQIFFFDHYMASGAFPFCSMSSTYGFHLWQTFKTASGWSLKDFGVIQDEKNSCGGSSCTGEDFSLPSAYGDRYGEFCTVTENPGGGLSVTTVSRFNQNLLVYHSLGNDTTFDSVRVDDALRIYQSGWGYPCPFQLNRYFTWEYPSAEYSDNGTLNIVYGSSLIHGDNFCCEDLFQVLLKRIQTSPDTVIMDTLNLRQYTTQHQLEVDGNDSLFVTYSNWFTNAHLLRQSTDGGNTWVNDTIFPRPLSGAAPLVLHNDTLHTLFWDDFSGILRFAKRAAYDTLDVWVYENLNESEKYGEALDALIEQSGSDYTVQVAYNETANNENLLFAEGTKLSGWSFSYENADTAGRDFRAITMVRGPAGEPIVLYAAGSPGDLRMAVKSAGSWSVTTLDTAHNPSAISAVMGAGDTLHIAYVQSDSSRLYYMKKPFAGAVVVNVPVDSTALPASQYNTIALDPFGSPCMAYYDDSTYALHYATLSGGIWSNEMVYANPPSASGKYASLKFGMDGKPKIAFLDEQNQYVLLAERDTAGGWMTTLLDSASVFSMGKPTQLEIDKFGNPWVAYDFESGFPEIKLQHRDTIWREVAVSAVGHIARSFRFRVVNDDLFIIGKRTESGNEGIGLLYGPNGIYIHADEPAPGTYADVAVFPNPASGEVNFRIRMEQSGTASLTITDLAGHVIASPVSGLLPQGSTDARLDISSLSPGLYLCILETENVKRAAKLVIAQ